MKYIAITNDDHEYPGRVIFYSLGASRNTAMNLACLNGYKPHELMIVTEAVAASRMKHWSN